MNYQMMKRVLFFVISMVTISSVSFGRELPEVSKVNPRYEFEFKNYPNDVKPFLMAILAGDKEAGIELRYRLTLDVAINAEREGKVNVDPLEEIHGVQMSDLFGEENPSVEDVNSLARYLAFSLKRAAILEIQYKRIQKVHSFSGVTTPFNLFYYFWNSIGVSARPYIESFIFFFPIFRFPMLPYPGVSFPGF